MANNRTFPQADLFEPSPPRMELNSGDERTKAMDQLQALLMEAMTTSHAADGDQGVERRRAMTKITPDHLARSAFVYVRQSTAMQVAHNLESQRRQYGLGGPRPPAGLAGRRGDRR